MDTSLIIVIIVILAVLLIFSAFFSAAETAYTALSPGKLEEAVNKNYRWAKIIKKHYKSFGWTLSTILLANNFVNVGFSALLTYLLGRLISSSQLATILATFVATPIIVIAGEIFPKILAKKYSLRYLKTIAYIMNAVNIFFYPVTYPLSKLTLQSKVTNTEKDIINLLKIARLEGVIEPDEQVLAQNALELDSTIVSKIMTNRKDIISIKENETILNAKKAFASSGHSRLFVKNGNNYIGVIYLKDIFLLKDNEKINKYIKDLFSVSKSSLVSIALEKMRISKTHIAAVIEKQDSHKIVGLITVEDILEEIVGEIYDEHDKTESIREVSHFKFIASGTTPMKDIENEIDFAFDASQDINLKEWLQVRIKRKFRSNLRYEYQSKVVFKIIKTSRNGNISVEIIKK